MLGFGGLLCAIPWKESVSGSALSCNPQSLLEAYVGCLAREPFSDLLAKPGYCSGPASPRCGL